MRLALWLAVALLAGCASRPPATDGPAERTPPDLASVPDAVPRLEPVRSGGPNKPYEVAGVRYVPLAGDPALRERGGASWYGRRFHGQPTALGETYDMFAMTAAHKTMPLPSYARVRNPANGREIVVRVNDRGPFHPERVIDLSYTAALKLGVLSGVAPVEVERITLAEIRAGLAPAPEGGFWLQIGAFREREGALQLQRLLQREAPWLAALVTLWEEAPWIRVQAGPWPRRDVAETMAQRLADALPLQPFVTRR